MAKKGRPFVYQSREDKPVTISLRIPKELQSRLERHASQHRKSVSELVRDGIEMCLEEGADPRSRRTATPQEQEEYYDNTEGSAVLLDGASLLREMQAGFAQIQAMVQALELHAIPDILTSYYGNTAQHAAAIRAEEQVATTVPPAPTLRTNAVQAAPTSKPDKATVDARIHELRDQGFSYAAIATQLEAEGIPTLSGRGRWAKGNVERILSGRKTVERSTM